ncbi:hypothetical protein [Pigmentiphaga soli]|uniref:hypothetical protein n=1 Tax=Pigmentiphaga soli TaxID=1007095 RepID=UPI0031ED2F45
MGRIDVVGLLRLIDWILTLPPELDEPYLQAVEQAATDQLRRWSRRILAAESLQALFQENSQG